MLSLKRKEGSTTLVYDEAGHVLRIHLYDIHNGRVTMVLEDDAHHFRIMREEREQGLTPST